MLDSDKRRFSEIMDATFPIYRMEASVQTKRIWWEVLKRYSIEEVSAAFSEHIGTNSKGITPADIKALIDSMNPDGRPGADEAWAMLPYEDESASVVMTDEMAEAFGIAQGIQGDAIAARMAFKDAYRRIVENNKRNGIKPHWFASLGTDPGGREQALNEAVALGRISNTYAHGLLPPPLVDGRKVLANLAAALPASEGVEESHEAQLDRIRKMLGMEVKNAA